MIKGIFTDFLVAPLGIGVSNSNGGKNEADALVTYLTQYQLHCGKMSLFSFQNFFVKSRRCIETTESSALQVVFKLKHFLINGRKIS